MGQASVGVKLLFYKHEQAQVAHNPEQLPSAATIGWNELSGIIDIGNDGPDATVIDTKSLNSPGYFMTKKRGFRDPGNWTLTVNYDKQVAARLLYLFKDFVLVNSVCYQTDERWWEIRIPHSTCGALFTRISSCGFLKKSGMETPEDDRITQDVEIELSGPPIITLADGSLLDQSGLVQTPKPGEP
jgi:hypothetical protein